jgi:hypothetical protein
LNRIDRSKVSGRGFAGYEYSFMGNWLKASFVIGNGKRSLFTDFEKSGKFVGGLIAFFETVVSHEDGPVYKENSDDQITPHLKFNLENLKNVLDRMDIPGDVLEDVCRRLESIELEGRASKKKKLYLDHIIRTLRSKE